MLLENDRKYSLVLNETEIKILSDIVKVLEPFQELVMHIQGTTYSTMNVLLLGVENVKNIIEKVKSKTEHSIVAAACRILLANIDGRLKITDEIVVAAMLDPCFQHIEAIDDYCTKNNTTRIDLIEKMCRKYGIEINTVDVTGNIVQENDTAVSPTSSVQSQPQPVLKKPKLNFRAKLFALARNNCQVTNSVADEYRSFRKEMGSVDEKLNDFWKRKEVDYKTLAKLAKVLIGRPLTTARAESEFSVAGALVTAKRASLSPITIEKTLFVHDNYNLFKESKLEL